jgi:hypothetical protein
MITVIIFIFGIIIALISGIIIGTKINEMNKYKNCKLVKIKKMRME